MSDTQLLTDLESLYALLEPPYAWCKGDLMRVDERAPAGMAWDLLGACAAVAGLRYLPLRDALADSLPFPGWVTEFNDTHKKRDVLRLIQRTIEQVKADG
jgi:hypothetical protein